MKGVCFICNLTNEDFTTNNLSFDKHRESLHSEWNYFDFLFGIIQKPSNQLTGTESRIKNLYLKKEISWFPHRRTKLIENQEEKATVESRLMSIEGKVNMLLTLGNN
jgi:hypothetical protein